MKTSTASNSIQMLKNGFFRSHAREMSIATSCIVYVCHNSLMLTAIFALASKLQCLHLSCKFEKLIVGWSSVLPGILPIPRGGCYLTQNGQWGCRGLGLIYS